MRQGIRNQVYFLPLCNLSSLLEAKCANFLNTIIIETTEDVDPCSHLSVNVAWTGGNMLEVIKWIKSPKQCRSKCLENTECRAWTYVLNDFVSHKNFYLF